MAHLALYTLLNVDGVFQSFFPEGMGSRFAWCIISNAVGLLFKLLYIRTAHESEPIEPECRLWADIVGLKNKFCP